MSKKVKIIANVEVREDGVPQNLWGVTFTPKEKQYHAEVDEELAKEMVDNGRAILAGKTAAPAPAASTNSVDFASDEAGELNAKLVADKILTAKEFKKIDGTGLEGAITTGDINDYVAAKTAPATPPAPAAVATK